MLSDAYVPGVDGSLGDHLDLICESLLPLLHLLHGLIGLGRVINAVGQLNAVVDEGLACDVHRLVIAWVADDLRRVSLLVLLQSIVDHLLDLALVLLIIFGSVDLILLILALQLGLRGGSRGDLLADPLHVLLKICASRFLV